MKKSEMVKAVSEQANCTQKQADLTVEAFLGFVAVLTMGDSLITSIGTFKRVLKPARKARNPRTGEMIDVPEKIVLVFKARK